MDSYRGRQRIRVVLEYKIDSFSSDYPVRFYYSAATDYGQKELPEGVRVELALDSVLTRASLVQLGSQVGECAFLRDGEGLSVERIGDSTRIVLSRPVLHADDVLVVFFLQLDTSDQRARDIFDRVRMRRDLELRSRESGSVN